MKFNYYLTVEPNKENGEKEEGGPEGRQRHLRNSLWVSQEHQART